jgi:hypothetical protein
MLQIGAARWRAERLLVCSSSPLTPSPPAEKATARQDQAGQSRTGDGAGNRGGKERDLSGGVGDADNAAGGDGEARGHRIEAIARVGLAEGGEILGKVGWGSFQNDFLIRSIEASYYSRQELTGAWRVMKTAGRPPCPLPVLGRSRA